MRTEARTLGPLSPRTISVPVNRYVTYALIVIAGVAVDLSSKSAVFAALHFPGMVEVGKLGHLVDFSLQTSINQGALWGFGQGWTSLFAILSVAAVAGIIYFLFIARHAHSKWLTVALALVTAGALGNLYDRLGLHGLTTRNGASIYGVRDFLDFVFFETFHWATFNIADSMLVAGSIMLVIYSFRTVPAENSHPAEPGLAINTQ